MTPDTIFECYRGDPFAVLMVDVTALGRTCFNVYLVMSNVLTLSEDDEMVYLFPEKVWGGRLNDVALGVYHFVVYLRPVDDYSWAVQDHRMVRYEPWPSHDQPLLDSVDELPY